MADLESFDLAIHKARIAKRDAADDGVAALAQAVEALAKGLKEQQQQVDWLYWKFANPGC